MTGVHILIPAAGASARMRGADKLMQEVDGVAQLRRAVEAARGAGATRVWVTLPPYGDAMADTRHTALNGSWARAAAAQSAAGLLILLADLPEIEAADLARFVAAHETDPEAVWRGVAEDGTTGHPVLIPARLFSGLIGLTGDTGARAVLAGEDVRAVPLPGQRAVTDLDTPEDWAAWRARTGR